MLGLVYVYVYTGWNEIPAPPAMVQTGKHQGMIIIVLFEEFNCRSKEKNCRVIAQSVWFLSKF